jgi:hypothetical protein
MTQNQKQALTINLVAVVFLAVGLILGSGVSKLLKRGYVAFPKSKAPGYIFVLDSITYQVRPIKITRTLYWDGKADSVYKTILEIANGKEK